MQRIALLGALLLIPFLAACGKFADKFSRINGSFTRVHFSGREDSLEQATVDGGIAIYFINAADNNQGRTFVFSSKEAINSKSVVLPNGQYKVFAFGWDGPSYPFTGSSRCGKGDNGSLITLSGASTTVAIGLDPGNCSYGSSTEFAFAEHTNTSTFDTLNFVLCNGAASIGCSQASGSSWFLKTELLGGSKDGANFTESSGYTLSTCTVASSSANIVTSYKIPVGGSLFSPPVRFSVYSSAGCSGVASGTYSFPEGLKQYMGAASGSSYFLYTPASGSAYQLSVSSYF